MATDLGGLRPCPCDFRVRAEIAEGRSDKDEQNKIAEDFLRSYSRGEGVPRSVALKEWARKNKYREVPLDLPNTWGFEVTVE